MEKYRTFWSRFFAGFIDGFVFLPLWFADMVFWRVPERGPAIIIIWSGIIYSAYWLYSVILHARYGQTLGKMAMQVKVLDVSENQIPTFRQAFLRDAGYVILNSLSLAYLIYLVFAGEYVHGAENSSVPEQVLTWASLGWFLVEIITMSTNSKRRALHDYIAGTVVIRST